MPIGLKKLPTWPRSSTGCLTESSDKDMGSTRVARDIEVGSKLGQTASTQQLVQHLDHVHVTMNCSKLHRWDIFTPRHCAGANVDVLLVVLAEQLNGIADQPLVHR